MAEAERAGGGQNDMEKELTCSVSWGSVITFLVLRRGALDLQNIRSCSFHLCIAVLHTCTFYHSIRPGCRSWDAPANC